MSTVKITIDSSDKSNLRFRTEKQTIDSLGQEYLDKNGILIDAGLMQNFQNTMLQYKQMQAILWGIYKQLEVQNDE